MKNLSFVIGAAALAALIASPAMAQSSKSSGFMESGLNLSAAAGADAMEQIFSTQIKAPNAKELAIDLSMMCGLFTLTTVKSKGGKQDTSVAEAAVRVDITVVGDDGDVATVVPSSAIYCSRGQVLSAKLGGIIENLAECTGLPDPDIEGGYEECSLTDEEISLGLKTLNANAYNFFALNLPGSDVYTVTATVTLDACAGSVADYDATDTTSPEIPPCVDGGEPDERARAFVAGATMHVEEARFVN